MLRNPCIDAQISGVVSRSSPALTSTEGIGVRYLTIGSHPKAAARTSGVP